MAIEQGAADDPDRTIMLIDCGLMFPDADMHGIDLILPDFTYLRENAQRISALVLTHGHEDHVGAIQYLLRDHDGIGDLRDDPLPIYGAALTLGLARNRIEEAGLLPKTDMRTVADGETVDIGPLRVEFIPVTHSVPHAHAIAVHTAQGVVLHSGDYKIDLTPVDSPPHRPGPHRPAREGPGHPSADGRLDQRRGGRVLAERDQRRHRCCTGLFAAHRDRRIVTASFASHLHRIQQIADARRWPTAARSPRSG